MRLLFLCVLLACVALPFQEANGADTTTITADTTTTTTTTAATTTTTAATTTTDKSKVKCTRSCTHTYNPVCGTYNGRKRTFENRCIFRAIRRCARRRGTLSTLGIRFLHTGRCP
ncbi:protein new-glue 1-like [Anastrepha ludens]|uniref:protein new-glue 1-like n=1 Tax=Anastrepha ludens TaxID=28586 RepID=UPI0023AF2202|nr:protein new-glue 1-like [Anastrepha ludens]XP_053951704.1 protein new-glue 1-like [Anastrepha ludens]